MRRSGPGMWDGAQRRVSVPAGALLVCHPLVCPAPPTQGPTGLRVPGTWEMTGRDPTGRAWLQPRSEEPRAEARCPGTRDGPEDTCLGLGREVPSCAEGRGRPRLLPTRLLPLAQALSADSPREEAVGAVCHPRGHEP